MKTETFDKDIANALSHYGKFGVTAELLSASDKPTPVEPGDSITVSILVTPVVKDPQPYVDTWHYSGIIYKTTGPVLVGLQVMDAKRLIGSVEAAKKLPPGFPLGEASCSLYWPLYPGVTEPAYHFSYSTTTFSIGAYSGNLIK